MVQNLLDYEFLGILLCHDNGIRAFDVVIKRPEVMDVSHHNLIVDEILDSVNRAGVRHDLIRAPVQPTGGVNRTYEWTGNSVTLRSCSTR